MFEPRPEPEYRLLGYYGGRSLEGWMIITRIGVVWMKN